MALGLLAVTVVGDDRPGIVADVTTVLADLSANLEDSTMTLLRGHFAMIVLVRTDRSREQVEEALRPLSNTGQLAVDVRPLPGGDGHEEPGQAYLLHVHGADRPGIVAAMTNVVARHRANIVNLGTRLGDAMYILDAELVLPNGQSIDAMEEELAIVAGELGVDFHVEVVDYDVL